MSLDQTYHALADASRRDMLRRLASSPGLTISELSAPLPIGMPTVMKHLDVLARVHLINRKKTGRSVTVTLTPNAMGEAMRWLQHTEAFWSARIDRIVDIVEGERT